MPVLIVAVTLRISGLVLSEAILSYLQLGVEESAGSWGRMIDAARLELAREPAIWWNFAAAGGALFGLVFSFNVIADGLRDALDPRLRAA
jgi:peptide/nickel transport system permease protein